MAAHDEGLRHRSAAASGGTVDGGTVDGGTPQHWSRRAAEAREAAAACRLDSMLQLFALITHGATQAASLLAWRGLPPGERFQRVASTLLVGLFWVLPTFAPRFHMRHRKLLIVTSRVQFFLWPLLRQPRGEWWCARRRPCMHACAAACAAACAPRGATLGPRLPCVFPQVSRRCSTPCHKRGCGG